MLGDSVKVSTPLGINKLGSVGSAYSMFVGAYKGGRNEGLMYGKSGEKYYDWDVTSCYTTIMSMLGNPDYKKGKYVSQEYIEDWISKEELMNSYTVMLVDFKHKAEIKYPIIPVLAKGEKANYVYSREGKDVIITGLEYLKLKELKTKITVKSCYYIPFEEREGKLVNKPYSKFIKYVQGERRRYKKGLCEERM